MNKFINFAAGFLLASVTTASADDLPKLTIYTYDSFVSDWGPGPAIKKAFEKTC
ncbi:MAG: thiamine ABC transporter substrate-binding protein, partial [Rhodobacterales bacterium]|nr:thiamine ABC transporter substrate-binding protein [Rhodobacterales bacterium]